MSLMKSLAGATCAFALLSGVAVAEPAIIFDLGGKFDKSFNEAAFNGAERWAKETGGTYKELEMQDEAQRAFLEVSAENPAAIALYDLAGFRTEGRRRGYYAPPQGARIDALVMARDL